MKGVIFNLLEEFVCDEHGGETWERVLDEAAVDGAYTSLGQYADAELMSLVAQAASQAGQSVDAVLRRFGRASIARLRQRYPQLFERYDSSRALVMEVNTIIHPEVRKLYPDASPPEFACRLLPDDRVEMRYESERRLCSLAVGFIEGTAALFDETVHVEHSACMHEGARACLLELEWSP